MKIKRSEIQRFVMMCPYCGTEVNNDYDMCCGEPHAEEHIDTGDDYIPVDEVEIIEDVPDEQPEIPVKKSVAVGEIEKMFGIKK